MKRLVILLAAVLAFSSAASAAVPAVRDIDISVTLQSDGSALIREVWDMTAGEGTEWYLPRYNLGAVDIRDFRVTDERGRRFVRESVWNVNRSLSEKDGKCGMVNAKSGYELCWGLGSYGDHIFTVEYTMTNVVQAMDDYDMLHVQFVNPGIRPYPQHASVTVTYPHATIDSTNCAAWGFGFNGNLTIGTGEVKAETLEPFSSDDYSVILLLRFDKGLFQPQYYKGGAFQDKLDEAFEGSAYQDFLDSEKEERRATIFGLSFCAIIVALIGFAKSRATRRRNIRMFGVEKLKEIGYERDIPFNGNLLESYHVLSKVKPAAPNAVASAMILRMIYNKSLLVYPSEKKNKIDIYFDDAAAASKLGTEERKLYNMMREASGSDMILQDKEFSRWSRLHQETVSDWVDSLSAGGSAALGRDNFVTGMKFSEEGQMHARRVIGLKNYLKDFTLIDEKSAPEVTLWQDYLVYAALYGIADKVAAQLKDINPQVFEQAVGYDPLVMNRVLYMSNSMGCSITNTAAAAHAQTVGSVSGHGGFTSFGGGGGFSGGGFGGGAR